MVSKYGDWTRGNDEALLNKLGGEEVARRLLDCREVKVVFDSSTKSAIITGFTPTFKVWRTITHRGRRNAESYRAGLLSTKCRISNWANDLLGRFEISSVDEEVDLGCASVAELGFTKATRFDAICDRIVAMGNELCLPEDGPVLREQYLEQPLGEWVRLAMKAFRDSSGCLGVFCVECGGGGLWFGRSCDRPDFLFDPDRQFVFRLRKRPLVA